MAIPEVATSRKRHNQRKTKKERDQQKSIVYDPVKEELFKEFIAQNDKEFGRLFLPSMTPILISMQRIPEYSCPDMAIESTFS